MTPITDQYDDVNRQRLHLLLKVHEVPPFVKQSADKALDTLEDVAQTVFAYPVRRKFPCHTKVATWLSTAFFLDEKHKLPEDEARYVRDQIEKAANYHGIAMEFHELCADFEKRSTPRDIPDEQFGLVYEIDGIGKRRLFPAHTKEACLKSMEMLYTQADKFPLIARRHAARNLIKCSTALNITANTSDISEWIEKAAGYGMSSPKEVGEGFAQRVYMLGERHNDIREKLAEMAVETGAVDKLSHAQLEKAAFILDAVDRDTGIFSQYPNGLDMPEEVCFNTTEKQAEDSLFENIQLTNGHYVSRSSLHGLPLEKISKAFGDDFLNSVLATDGMTVDFEKFAEILPTLPRGDADLIEKLMDSANVKALG